MSAVRVTRPTEADRAAWAGFAQHIKPLPGRKVSGHKLSGDAGATSPASTAAPEAGSPGASAPSAAPHRPAASAGRQAGGRGGPGAGDAALAIGAPPAGVDRATWQRFRTGKLAAARKLDLHGLTAQLAFQALVGFLRAAHADRVRCVEIVTGRGSPGGDAGGSDAGNARGTANRIEGGNARGNAGGRGVGRGVGRGGGEGTGVLRRELPLWLNRPDIRPLVLGAAHPHPTNPGAVRLLLRRIR